MSYLAAQDANATNAAWAAYYSQYYSQMQQMAAQQQMPTNTTAALSTSTSTTAATQMTGQPAADGTEDYSAQWAAYYR